MPVEIVWLGVDANVVAGTEATPRCRYCVRTLRPSPATPAEIEPHCAAAGCRWCAECAAGETSVSPLQR